VSSRLLIIALFVLLAVPWGAQVGPQSVACHTSEILTTGLNHHALSGGFPHDDPNDSVYLYWAAEQQQGVCWRCMLDTMKMYCEQHPYATNYPGEVLDAINATWGATNNLPGRRKSDCIDEFNWLIKMQPVNSEIRYQYVLIETMAETMSAIDLNEEANLWYNWSLLFPDSETVASAWDAIHSVRSYQKMIPQDTIPFHKLTFPMQPLPGGNEDGVVLKDAAVSFSVVPNIVTEATVATFELPLTGTVSISVYDLLGNELVKLASGVWEKGTHSIPLRATGLSKGIYYVRLSYGNTILTRKIIIDR
jgi:hypothetical protein